MILDSTRGNKKSAVHVLRRQNGGCIVDQAGHRIFVDRNEARQLAETILAIIADEPRPLFEDGKGSEWVDAQREMWRAQTGSAEIWE